MDAQIMRIGIELGIILEKDMLRMSFSCVTDPDSFEKTLDF